MEIRRFLETIYRRLPAVFAVAALAMVVVTVAGILIPPVYRSQTIVRVLWDVGVYDLSPREFVADRIVTTYTEALKSEPVLEEAIHRVSGENPSLTAAESRRQGIDRDDPGLGADDHLCAGHQPLSSPGSGK